MRFSVYILLAFIFFSFSAASTDETPYVQGELIIQLDAEADLKSFLKEVSFYQGEPSGIIMERQLSEVADIYLFSYDYNLISSDKIKPYLRKFNEVRIVQFNHYVEDRATVPNDPEINTQWHHVDGSDNDIDSDLAWDITTGGQTSNGDDIVVCVIEGGGANYNHPDLIDNHWTNTSEIAGNGIDDDGNGYIDDVNGWNPVSDTDVVGSGNHGTAVSGMIGAKGNNGIGGAGVNWDVKIMQVALGSLTEANVIEAYEYPLVMRQRYNNSGGQQGALVVATNASWGIDNANPANYPVWCAYYDTLGAEGILNCGATANNNVNVDVNGDMPTGCSSDYMIGVTATNSSDQRTFSGYGSTSIDLGAPGESVYLPSGGSGYSNTSGTSFASPCVAGAIALLYSAPCTDIANQALSNPQNTADLVKGHIFNGVDLVSSLSNEVSTGGRLNVKNSLDLLLNSCGPLPDCLATGLTLSEDCYFNPQTNAVEASITVTASMNENFCTVQSICYTGLTGGETCIDVSNLALQNGDEYTISGLTSNNTYTVYFTTTEDTSTSASVITQSCSNLVAGCTDSEALNYLTSADIDDGSCIYACDEVSFVLDTDCYANEIAWTITSDADGSIINQILAGTYSNLTSYTWSECLDDGCYTLTITDTYGDGLNGTAFGCAVDGNYQMLNNSDASVIFEMGAADYGTEIVHNFCVNSGGAGCTDQSACNFSATATTEDGSCVYPGCTDPSACNYSATAGCDNGSCQEAGCTNQSACNFSLNAVCDDGSCIIPPSNDVCEGAVPLNEGVNSISNVGACIDQGFSVPNTGCNTTDGWCAQNGIENDVFYSFTVPEGQAVITIETSFDGSGTLTDTQMAVFNSCSGSLISANDDGAEDLYMSRIEFDCNALQAGVTYLVLIDGYDGDAGTANLTLTIDETPCAVLGCTDPTAENYNAQATLDDESCVYLCDVDTEAPIYTSVPEDLTLECGDDVPVIWPIAEDNCTEDLFITYTDSQVFLTCPTVYEITREFITEDLSGNQAFYTQIITLTDNSAPVFLSVHDDYSVSCDALPPIADNTEVIDNCTEIFESFFQTDNGNGTYTHEYVASDLCGNTVFLTQTVTVIDDVAPTLEGSLNDLTIDCGEELPALIQPSFTDNCSSSVQVSLNESSVPTGGDGVIYTYIWTAIDDYGNTAVESYTVEVLDNCDLCWVADFNSNGMVEVSDLTLMLGDFQCTSNCSTDMDGNGSVTVVDLSLFLSYFGTICQN